MNEGQRIEQKAIRNLDQLKQRLFDQLRERPGTRVAFYGYTYQTASLVNEFFSVLGDRFVPVCIIDNKRAGEAGPVKSCAVLSFEDAEHLEPRVDLVAVMIDSPSLTGVLSQLAFSSFREKEILFVHREAQPLADKEFSALAGESTEALTRHGAVWYTDERNWYCCYQYLKQTAALEGDVAEFGVFQGGSAYFFAKAMQHFGLDEKLLFLYDTFQGIPQSSALDLVDVNDFSGNSLDRVKSLLGNFNNVRFIPGDVTKTFLISGEGPFSLVHVDCDQFEVTGFLCKQLYPRMVPGGILMFQNYSFGATLGERIAVDHFFQDKPEAVLLGYDGAAFVIKQ